MRPQRPRRRSSFSSARPKGAGRSFSPRLDVRRHSLPPKYSPQPITTTSPPPLPTLSPLIRPRNLSEKLPPSSSSSQIASTPPSLIESSTQKPKLSSTNTIKGDHISHPQPKNLPPSTRSQPKPTRLRTAAQRAQAVKCSKLKEPDIWKAWLAEMKEEIEAARLADEGYVSPSTPPERFDVVYDIKTSTIRRETRTSLLGNSNLPLEILPVDSPPFLVDGRRTIVELPRWKWWVTLYWRSWDGQDVHVVKRVVKLPGWVWKERNLGRQRWLRWCELFVEHG